MAWESMKVECFEVGVKCHVQHVWRALLEHAHLLLVAAQPGDIDKLELLQGPPHETGTIYMLNLANQSILSQHGFTWAKVKYEEVNHNHFLVKLNLVGGGALGNLWHSLVYTIKVMVDPVYPHDHAIVRHILEFQRIGAHQIYLSYKEVAIRTTHSMESYIASSPYGHLGTPN